MAFARLTHAAASIKSAGVVGFSSLLDWLQADAIIDSIPDSLLATKVALRRLDAHVTEQKLNLLKFASCLMAKAGTGLDSSAWVKRYFRELGSGWINREFAHRPRIDWG